MSRPPCTILHHAHLQWFYCDWYVRPYCLGMWPLASQWMLQDLSGFVFSVFLGCYWPTSHFGYRACMVGSLTVTFWQLSASEWWVALLSLLLLLLPPSVQSTQIPLCAFAGTAVAAAFVAASATPCALRCLFGGSSDQSLHKSEWTLQVFCHSAIESPKLRLAKGPRRNRYRNNEVCFAVPAVYCPGSAFGKRL